MEERIEIYCRIFGSQGEEIKKKNCWIRVRAYQYPGKMEWQQDYLWQRKMVMLCLRILPSLFSVDLSVHCHKTLRQIRHIMPFVSFG